MFSWNANLADTHFQDKALDKIKETGHWYALVSFSSEY
jgi:hypothetical protein